MSATITKAAAAAGFVASGAGCHRKFSHPSGWRVEHCGHPTALWPWAVYDPDGRIHTSGQACDLGRAFMNLQPAIEHVMRHLRGELVGGGR